MGYSITEIAFRPNLALKPHSVSAGALRHLDQKVVLKDFAGKKFAKHCSLELIEESGEFIARRPDGEWVRGPMCDAVELDCMRCERTFWSLEVAEFCPACRVSPNRMNI